MEEQRTSLIRKDLLTIFGILAVLLVGTGVLLYIDGSQEVVARWSEQFYALLLRR